MDWLQTLLDNSSTPVWTAFLLGLLTALSPCPLATNIAAIGFIGKDIENRRRIFRNGLLYTLGRILSYTLLGVVLILILKEGSSMFGIQKTIGAWGELVLGPLLFLIGLFMLFGDRLNLPQFGFQGNAEGLARKGGWGALIIGALFALAFCPTSGVFYFGMLIPMSATATAGYLLPVVFAIATAIPVLVVVWILAFSVQQLGSFYGKMQKVQKWMNRIVGVLFIVIGIYYSWIMYLQTNLITNKIFTSMEIKVLGPGCAKCKTTYNVIEKVIKENNLDVKLTKVDDIMEMVSYNIMTTPAVVVDEVVKMKGQVPTESDVKKLLGIG